MVRRIWVLGGLIGVAAVAFAGSRRIVGRHRRQSRSQRRLQRSPLAPADTIAVTTAPPTTVLPTTLLPTTTPTLGDNHIDRADHFVHRCADDYGRADDDCRLRARSTLPRSTRSSRQRPSTSATFRPG